MGFKNMVKIKQNESQSFQTKPMSGSLVWTNVFKDIERQRKSRTFIFIEHPHTQGYTYEDVRSIDYGEISYKLGMWGSLTKIELLNLTYLLYNKLQG